MVRRAAMILVLALVVGGCQKEAAPQAEANAPAAKPTVVTTCFPVDYLARRLAGSSVMVKNILPEGEDPPDWQPPAQAIVSAGDADLIVANGAGFEGWMATASLPRGKVVEASKGLELIHLEGKSHSHGGKDSHSHAGVDPHVWSDPLAYAKQGKAVFTALAAMHPAGVSASQTALEALTAELAALDGAYREVLIPLRGLKLAASHPAFNYLARRYDLPLTSFDFDPESPPEATQLAAFSAWAGDGPVYLLWEGEPTQATQAAFAQTVRHVYIDPLEQPAEGAVYDYMAQAMANVARFKALGEKSVGGMGEAGGE